MRCVLYYEILTDVAFLCSDNSEGNQFEMTTLKINYVRVEAVQVSLEVLDADLRAGPGQRKPTDESEDRISSPIIRRIRSKGEDV